MALLTKRLLNRATKLAVQSAQVSSELSDAFEERYGCNYSDVDCDWLIDTLDYGHSIAAPTIEECDYHMAKCGAYPKEPRP